MEEVWVRQQAVLTGHLGLERAWQMGDTGPVHVPEPPTCWKCVQMMQESPKFVFGVCAG